MCAAPCRYAAESRWPRSMRARAIAFLPQHCGSDLVGSWKNRLKARSRSGSTSGAGSSAAICAALATTMLTRSAKPLRSAGTADAGVVPRRRTSPSICSSIRRLATYNSLASQDTRGASKVGCRGARRTRKSKKEQAEIMKRTANAQWSGDLKAGKGNISTASGVLTSTPYSFGTRFEEGKGTNPEELLAAAHAGCFTMAVSAQLASAGLKADSLDTTCTITLEKKDDGFAITESHLELNARIPGASQEAFDKATQAAKAGCPVSKLYKTNITL